MEIVNDELMVGIAQHGVVYLIDYQKFYVLHSLSTTDLRSDFQLDFLDVSNMVKVNHLNYIALCTDYGL